VTEKAWDAEQNVCEGVSSLGMAVRLMKRTSQVRHCKEEEDLHTVTGGQLTQVEGQGL
jgi:hypothetical protein